MNPFIQTVMKYDECPGFSPDCSIMARGGFTLIQPHAAASLLGAWPSGQGMKHKTYIPLWVLQLTCYAILRRGILIPRLEKHRQKAIPTGKKEPKAPKSPRHAWNKMCRAVWCHTHTTLPFYGHLFCTCAHQRTHKTCGFSTLRAKCKRHRIKCNCCI